MFKMVRRELDWLTVQEPNVPKSCRPRRFGLPVTARLSQINAKCKDIRIGVLRTSLWLQHCSIDGIVQAVSILDLTGLWYTCIHVSRKIHVHILPVAVPNPQLFLKKKKRRVFFAVDSASVRWIVGEITFREYRLRAERPWQALFLWIDLAGRYVVADVCTDIHTSWYCRKT